MTTEAKNLVKKLMPAIIIFACSQLLLSIIGNVIGYKINEYRLNKVETEFNTFKADFEKNIKPDINILSWMHNIGIRDAITDDHEHKN